MKKILLVLILLFLILPVSANNDNFDDWAEHYYDSNTTQLNNFFNDLTDDELEKEDFLTLDYIYMKVFSDENSTEIKNRMLSDFEENDADNNSKLSFNEFKSFFNLIYGYYHDGPDDYDLFKKTDLNDDGRISIDEFEEISYIFAEDSFWWGYSIEEISQSEFDNVNSYGDDYLNFTEFKNAV